MPFNEPIGSIDLSAPTATEFSNLPGPADPSFRQVPYHTWDEIDRRMAIANAYLHYPIPTLPSSDYARQAWAQFSQAQVTFAKAVQNNGLFSTVQNDGIWNATYQEINFAMNPNGTLNQIQSERAKTSSALGTFMDTTDRYGLSVELWIGSGEMDDRAKETMGILDNLLRHDLD